VYSRVNRLTGKEGGKEGGRKEETGRKRGEKKKGGNGREKNLIV
jgi:hypothetical protein